MDALAAVLAVPRVQLLVVVGYLAGSIPFGLILTRLVAGTDVRAAGSGNIGATNVARVAGRTLGIFTLVLDALKGWVPVVVAGTMALPVSAEPHRLLGEGLVGLAAVTGHCFPAWLKLRGGKGVATGLGVILAHRPIAALLGIVGFLLVVAVARRVSAGSLVGALIAGVTMLAMGPRDLSLVPIGLCLGIIVAKHHANIRRLLTGRELKV